SSPSGTSVVSSRGRTTSYLRTIPAVRGQPEMILTCRRGPGYQSKITSEVARGSVRTIRLRRTGPERAAATGRSVIVRRLQQDGLVLTEDLSIASRLGGGERRGRLGPEVADILLGQIDRHEVGGIVLHAEQRDVVAVSQVPGKPIVCFDANISGNTVDDGLLGLHMRGGPEHVAGQHRMQRCDLP